MDIQLVRLEQIPSRTSDNLIIEAPKHRIEILIQRAMGYKHKGKHESYVSRLKTEETYEYNQAIKLIHEQLKS